MYVLGLGCLVYRQLTLSRETREQLDALARRQSCLEKDTRAHAANTRVLAESAVYRAQRAEAKATTDPSD
jgi:hypothetical protein